MGQRGLEDRGHVFVRRVVIDVLPLASRANEPQAAQEPQLVRDRRLREGDELRQIADAELADRQQMKDLRASRVSEGFEDCGSSRESVRGGPPRFDGSHALGIDVRRALSAVAHAKPRTLNGV